MTRPALRTLPWALVLALLGTIAGVAGLAALISPAGTAPAVIGALGGTLGALLAPRGREVPVMILGLAALGLLLVAAGQHVAWLLSLLLCVCVAMEARRTGGRASIALLFVILSLRLVPGLPPIAAAVPFAVGGLLIGWLAARVLGFAGAAATKPASRMHAAGRGVFLAVGLALTFWVTEHIDQPLEHWLVMMFLFRAMAPMDETAAAARRFAVGALLGSLVGLALIVAGVPGLPVLTMLAMMALLIAGLRMIPAPQPFAPAAFSAAAVLGVASVPGAALFRVEAAAVVLVLSTVLAAAIPVTLQALSRLASRVQSNR
jgi:hypothetical protein